MPEEPRSTGAPNRLRVLAITVLATAAAGAVAVLIVRNQIARHRRELFSPNVLQRLAALGYMARRSATVDNILLLRDFISWEPRRLLRGRARTILRRMEDEARSWQGEAATAGKAS